MNPQHINPAAAALGATGAIDRWDLQSIMTRMSERYTEHERHAQQLQQTGDDVAMRIASACAYEAARFLSEYYRNVDTAIYTTWSRRSERAYLRAYNPPNEPADAIQGGRARDLEVLKEEEDDAGDEFNFDDDDE